MSGRFAASAARLAGLVGALLGWRPDEFWRATPAELAAIFEAMSPPGDAALGAGDIARLMDMFPDGEGIGERRFAPPLHHASHGPPPRAELGEDQDG